MVNSKLIVSFQTRAKRLEEEEEEEEEGEEEEEEEEEHEKVFTQRESSVFKG